MIVDVPDDVADDVTVDVADVVCVVLVVGEVVGDEVTVVDGVVEGLVVGEDDVVRVVVGDVVVVMTSLALSPNGRQDDVRDRCGGDGEDHEVSNMRAFSHR